VSECVWLLRHGDTEWSEHERHTGLRDVPLSNRGREQATHAGEVLAGTAFVAVLVSPSQRAIETARLAGLELDGEPWPELLEWDYGDYEGLTDEQTKERDAGWDLFRDGAPGGETAAAVAARVERVLDAIADIPGRCILVGHGKSLRALAARFLGQPIELGARLPMDPAAVSVLEQEQRAGPLLRLWNYTGAP
jgi:probable phosphoglycerate mutase